MSPVEREGSQVCPLCGCPRASLRGQEVVCANSGCCWHDRKHVDGLAEQARSDVDSWHDGDPTDEDGPEAAPARGQ